MEIIRLEGVKYEYPQAEGGGVTALNGLTFGIEKGQFVALLGSNGSGKSTLAKLLNGLYLPTEGAVYVTGLDTADEAHKFDVRSKVAMVFQNPDNQMIASIVEDDIAFGPENLGVPREEIVRRVDEALAAVGMSEYKQATPFKMSGGQKQRIAIAAVLAMEPDVLVLDESTAMLDPKGRREVMAILQQLRARGITVILITHYMDEAMQADRVLVLSEGRIVKDTVPQRLFDLQESLSCYGLDYPPVFALAKELAAAGLPLSNEVCDESTLLEAICQLL